MEVKLAYAKGKKSPKATKVTKGQLNEEFQTMLGQCLLARLKHDAVIAVFGYVGEIPDPWEDETRYAKLELAERHGVWVVVRKVN